jgi:flagellar biosynthesis/type III secretory pathway protein FliH
MAISHLLEDFGPQILDGGSHVITDDALEEARLASFESGYQAGWDDASAAHAAEQAHISSDFAQNLRALTFTYQDAHRHILEDLQPLLTQMVETILPDVAHYTLGNRLVLEMMKIAESHPEQGVELIVSPESREIIERIDLGFLPNPIHFLEDNTLNNGQVFLKFGSRERMIDLDSLLDEVKQAFHGAMNEFERKNKNG